MANSSLFPKLASSQFNRLTLKPPISGEELKPYGMAPKSAIIMGVLWPNYLEKGAPDGMAAMCTRLLARAEEEVAQAKRIIVDGRYTDEGRKEKARALLDALLNQMRPVTVGARTDEQFAPSISRLLQLIEVNAREAIGRIDALKYPAPTAPDGGAEWRAFVRASADHAALRMTKVRLLIKDGNGELAPSIVAGDHALSGLQRSDRARIQVYAAVVNNVEAVRNEWALAEKLAAIRMICIRVVNHFTAHAMLSPNEQKAAQDVATNTPNMDRLTGIIEGIEEAVAFLHAEDAIIPAQVPAKDYKPSEGEHYSKLPDADADLTPPPEPEPEPETPPEAP